MANWRLLANSQPDEEAVTSRQWENGKLGPDLHADHEVTAPGPAAVGSAPVLVAPAETAAVPLSLEAPRKTMPSCRSPVEPGRRSHFWPVVLPGGGLAELDEGKQRRRARTVLELLLSAPYCRLPEFVRPSSHWLAVRRFGDTEPGCIRQNGQMPDTPAEDASPYDRAYYRLFDFRHYLDRERWDPQQYWALPNHERYGRLFRAPASHDGGDAAVEVHSNSEYAVGVTPVYFGSTTAGGGWEELFVYTVQWISLAAASGVIGNVAHNAVTRMTAKIFSQRHEAQVSLTAYSPEDAELVAKLAVMTRCAQIGWSMPAFDDLKVTHKQLTGHDGIWQVVLTTTDLTAEVVVKSAHLHGQSMPVAILRKPTTNS